MMMKNVYLMLVGLLLISFTACKKNSNTGPNTGNDTDGSDTTVKVTSSVPSSVPAADGVTFTNSGKTATFNLYAPGKTTVSVVGEFNNWSPIAMKKSTDGTRFYIQLDGFKPGDEYVYQYYIDNTLKVADPYSHKILDPDNDKYIPASVYPNLKAYPTGKATGIVSVMQPGATVYNWQVANFTKPAQKNLVIYELLPRDFVDTHSYQTMTDTLDYIARLGVNAIELMPVSEFEGNSSWGYNSNFMFALDKYYGTQNAYKAFIDACHARGIAVIMDMVLEDQYGSSPMVRMYAASTDPSSAPAADNPWFDQANHHPDAAGWQLNHQRAATQYFTENVLKYWVQEYHIDGYRFDEAKGYTEVVSNDEASWAQYDQTRVDLWTKYNTYMKTLDPNLYVILEMFSANTEEAKYAAQGIMCWTNLSNPAEQATMGFNDAGGSWDISGLIYSVYGFPNTLPSPYGLVSYFESHDEVRLQFKNGQYGNNDGANYNIKDLATGLKRDEMGAALMFSTPGPKMVWQFGERGYDDATTGPDYGNLNNTSDKRTDPQPPHWEYMSDPNRAHLYSIYAKMIKMKIKNTAFSTTNFTYDLGNDAVKWIQLLDPTANVEVIGNFAVTSQTTNISFPSVGTWIDNLTGATFDVTSIPMSITLAPGEYHVYSNVALQQ